MIVTTLSLRVLELPYRQRRLFTAAASTPAPHPGSAPPAPTRRSVGRIQPLRLQSTPNGKLPTPHKDSHGLYRLRRSCRCPTCLRRAGSFSAGSATPGTRIIAAGARASWPVCCTNTGCAGCGGCWNGKTGLPSCPEPGAAVVSRLDSGVRRNDGAKIVRLWARSSGCRPGAGHGLGHRLHRRVIARDAGGEAPGADRDFRVCLLQVHLVAAPVQFHPDAVCLGADAGGEGCPGPGRFRAARGDDGDARFRQLQPRTARVFFRAGGAGLVHPALGAGAGVVLGGGGALLARQPLGDAGHAGRAGDGEGAALNRGWAPYNADRLDSGSSPE